MGPTLRGTGGPRPSPPSGPRFRPTVWPRAHAVGERMSMKISDLQTIKSRDGGGGGVRRKRLRCQGEGRATPLDGCPVTQRVRAPGRPAGVALPSP